MNDYQYGNWMQMTELVLDDSLMQIIGMAESLFFVDFCVSGRPTHVQVCFLFEPLAQVLVPIGLDLGTCGSLKNCGYRSKLYFIIEYFITIKYLILTNHDPSN